MSSAQNPADKKAPLTVRITLGLFLVIALFWFAFSLLVVFNGHPSYSDMGVYEWIIVAITFLASIILAGLWFLLRKRFKLAWYFSVIMVAAMTLAGFFDEIGWVDIVFIVINLIPLVLLIIDRKWYLKIQS